MTNFKNALSLCGLSSQEASGFLGVSKSTVDSMASGRRSVSDKNWRSLSDLWQKINAAAADTRIALQATDEGIDPRMTANIPVDGHDDMPASAKGIAGAIAALEIIAGLPREEDRDEPTSEKPLLMPVSDIKLPEVGGRIGRILLRGRWYEQEMLDYIRSLGLGGNYLDVGANIGNHSVYFARNTVADRVFSFEPTRQARTALNKFVELNDLWEKISVIPYACSDQNGEIEVVETFASDKPPAKYPCRRIDDIIRCPISLVKMDIEGAEPFALRGAIRVLSESKPVMFIEVHDDKHMNEIMGIIGPIGYKATGKVWNASPTYEFAAK
ncbi:FkbM family methyltransferase [Sinorhizobium fredii]|uniref:FkbM family methyltransferase n=1 Tax=Rhizobium fredii TaxID=380 RepID=UPI0012FD8DB1|nr:FkbM family methyltransferase [Sinorhizobium fredii]